MDAALLLTTWLPATAVLAATALLAGAAFDRAARPDAPNRTAAGNGEPAEATARIDALLPQTQCGQCGYRGCRPYAKAIAGGDAINKCPPGGRATIAALARLLGIPPLALDPGHGREPSQRMVAFVREAECIGCTKCLPACPVDAIVGAVGLMHTVIAAECTGCDLCIEPCPVDCIDLIPAPSGGAAPGGAR